MGAQRGVGKAHQCLIARDVGAEFGRACVVVIVGLVDAAANDHRTAKAVLACGIGVSLRNEIQKACHECRALIVVHPDRPGAAALGCGIVCRIRCVQATDQRVCLIGGGVKEVCALI